MTFPKRQILRELIVTSMLLCLTVVLGGCVDKTPVLPPKVTRDIDATEKFLVTLAIGEPGVFGRVDAYANYSISNRSECVPTDHSIALGGVRPIALEELDLAVTQVGDGKFRAEALRHPFVAEDYYSRGICRWAISSVSFRMHSAGVFQTVTMGPDESKNSERKEALCFLDPPESNDSCRNPESIRPNIRHLFFPVTIEYRKD